MADKGLIYMVKSIGPKNINIMFHLHRKPHVIKPLLDVSNGMLSVKYIYSNKTSIKSLLNFMQTTGM